MSELQGLIDSLYSRFLLRDVFAKVVPGTIVLVALAVGLIQLSGLLTWVERVPLAAWPILYGVAWLAGFGVQQVPELFGLSHMYDKSKYGKNGISFIAHLRAVRAALTHDYDRQQLERYVVIKEAAGNAFFATMMAPFLWAVAAGSSIELVATQWPLLTVWVLACGLLRMQHLSALSNQGEYMDLIVPRDTLLKDCQTRADAPGKPV